MEEFDHLKIRMEDIKSATNNFSQDRWIGGGGFGPVYKGELSLPTGPTLVAFKRLDHRSDQGNPQFWKEIMMLSKCKHENLISLLHFSVEGDERVLVYEYASRGSLDRYISDANLTWNQRLHICIGVARALNYLHDPMKTQQRVLHRDIKSSNILLDENWTAKVSDFGLSKFDPANQSRTYLFSSPVGTLGYCDPLYSETGLLTKESDVYSFGVVLFEVMCGRLCCEYRDGELTGILVRMWKKCYDDKKLDDIIFKDLKIVRDSLQTFSAIAKRCLNGDHRDRPTMEEILKGLEVALEKQEVLKFKQRPLPNNLNRDRRDQPMKDEIMNGLEFALEKQKISTLAQPPLPENLNRGRTYRPTMDEIMNELEVALQKIKLAVHSLSNKSREELISLLSKGILIDDSKRWIWMNTNKQIHEMISAAECFHGRQYSGVDYWNSRFSKLVYSLIDSSFEVSVNTQFLSPKITYTMHIYMNVDLTDDAVYSGRGDDDSAIPFRYKWDEETDYRHSIFSRTQENGWCVAELYEFTNDIKTYKFTIEFIDNFGDDYHGFRGYALEGIEFRPI